MKVFNNWALSRLSDSNYINAMYQFLCGGKQSGYITPEVLSNILLKKRNKYNHKYIKLT